MNSVEQTNRIIELQDRVETLFTLIDAIIKRLDDIEPKITRLPVRYGTTSLIDPYDKP